MSTPQYLSKKLLTGKDNPSLDDLHYTLQLNALLERKGIYSKGWHEQVARSAKHHINEKNSINVVDLFP